MHTLFAQPQQTPNPTPITNSKDESSIYCLHCCCTCRMRTCIQIWNLKRSWFTTTSFRTCDFTITTHLYQTFRPPKVILMAWPTWCPINTSQKSTRYVFFVFFAGFSPNLHEFTPNPQSPLGGGGGGPPKGAWTPYRVISLFFPVVCECLWDWTTFNNYIYCLKVWGPRRGSTFYHNHSTHQPSIIFKYNRTSRIFAHIFSIYYWSSPCLLRLMLVFW